MTIERDPRLTLRPLERHDLRFVHEVNNDAKIMRYWFEEPYETFSELSQLYDQHVHDQRERRFVAVDNGKRCFLHTTEEAWERSSPRTNGTYLSQHGGEDAGKYLKRNGGG